MNQVDLKFEKLAGIIVTSLGIILVIKSIAYLM